jgi:P27 family predicted phage terminase small subunit
MGRRGPAPVPSQIKKDRGTFRKNRAPKNEIQPPPLLSAEAPRQPAPPVDNAPLPPCLYGCQEHLDRFAREEWARIVPELNALKLLSRIDTVALEAYCVNYSLARQYQVVAAAAPMVDVMVYGKGGSVHFVKKANPAAAEARRHWMLVRAFAIEFGLTPSSRTRVGADPIRPKPADSGESDPARAFLFGKGRPSLTVVGKAAESNG